MLELRKTGLEALSAEAAGVTMSVLRKEYEDDPAFQEEAEDMIALRCDEFEQEAIRRAVDGYEDPVYHKGEVVGHTRRYSDSLLSKVLTARKPKVYGEKKQITGADDGPLKVVIATFDGTQPTQAQLPSTPKLVNSPSQLDHTTDNQSPDPVTIHTDDFL